MIRRAIAIRPNAKRNPRTAVQPPGPMSSRVTMPARHIASQKTNCRHSRVFATPPDPLRLYGWPGAKVHRALVGSSHRGVRGGDNGASGRG